MSENDEDDEEIVHTRGRKPYNKSIPRIAREDYENKQPPPDYVSWQSKINSNDNKTIDDDVLESYLNESTYEEFDIKNASNIPSGSRIAYIRKKPRRWCSAGWLSRVEESYEDVDGVPFKKKKKYILYRAYNNSCFSVQIEDISKIYVMMPKVREIIVKMIYFQQPKKRTNFPVIVQNSEGDDVVIYYAKDSFQQEKIENQKKSKKALEDPDGWLFEDGTQICNIDEI